MDHMPPMHARDWMRMDVSAFRADTFHNGQEAGRRAVRAWYAREARCTCGCKEEHEIATRYTADGYRFAPSSWGAVYGSPLREGRDDRPRAAYRRAVVEVLRVVECLTWDEAIAAVREARKRHLDELTATEREVFRAGSEAYRAEQSVT